MALQQPIIDSARADVILASYPDWLALTDAQKDDAIFNASQYLANNYTCPDVDFASPPEEVEYATAYFAYEHSKNNLYSVSGTQESARITEKSGGAGSVSETVKYGGGGAQVSEGLKTLADDVLTGVCYPSGLAGGAVLITRM